MSDLDVGQVEVGVVAVAVAPAAHRAAVAAGTAALPPATQGAHQPPHRQNGGEEQYDGDDNFLCHSSKDPIWKNSVLTIQARPMV